VALKTKGGQFTPEAKAYAAVQRELALMYQMPATIHTWDWWQLYDDDKELWPFIIEIAEEEYGAQNSNGSAG
jgi:hypothetical protein